MALDERRILIGKIVHTIGFHESGNGIAGANHRVPGPCPAPLRLPGQAEPRLEVVDASVSVVAKSHRLLAADEVEVHVLAVVGAAGSGQLITQAQIQGQVVFDMPVISAKNAVKAVAEILVSAPAVALLHVLRQAEQEVCSGTPAGGASVSGKLTVESELTGKPGVTGIEVIHDVAISLETEVDHVLRVRPRHGVFKLQGCIVE